MKKKFHLSLAGIFCLAGLITFSHTRTVEAAEPVKGMVTHRISGCDYFIVQLRSDYSILEWYGGHDPDKDDVVYGDMRTYGMKSIHDETADESIRVWVEDYGLTKSSAMEKLIEQCE